MGSLAVSCGRPCRSQAVAVLSVFHLCLFSSLSLRLLLPRQAWTDLGYGR